LYTGRKRNVMEQRIIIDLAKIEMMEVANDTTIIVQFASGLTKRTSFKNTEDAESLSRAFGEFLDGERLSNYYMIWQSDLVWEE